VLAEYTLQPAVSHSRRLLGSLEAMMGAAGVAWADLDAVAVSQGPGAFTGLRIGMAAAKGIAMAADLPLIGVATLDALALQLPGCDRQVCCVLDARKEQVYAAFYQAGSDGCCQRTGDCLVLSPEALMERIDRPTLLAGPGVRVCAPWATGRAGIRLAAAGLFHPRAAMVGFHAAGLLCAGEAKPDDNLVPLYVRASEAELNLR
jgi:tRNA threonylcarbamoyladenosine biosynthesis protein TsaB